MYRSDYDYVTKRFSPAS